MKTYQASESVPYGLYFAARYLDIRFVGTEGEPLTGKPSAAYLRVPMPLTIFLLPVIGITYFVCLPAVIVFVVLFEAARLVGKFVMKTVERNTHLFSMQWEPSASYLNKQKKDDDKKHNEKK